MTSGAEVRAADEEAFREEWGQVVATLIRIIGDWDLAEESAQDALALALQRWPRDGVPRRPGAWLTTAARNRAIDRLRREATGAVKLREVAAMAHDPEPTDDGDVPDERLRLMFTCCHPALGLESQVALTLRTLAGLSTAEMRADDLDWSCGSGTPVTGAAQDLVLVLAGRKLPEGRLSGRAVHRAVRTRLDSSRMNDVMDRLRGICLSLPEASEKPFGGHTAPSFRVRDKLFVMTSEDGRYMTLKAGPGVQEALVADDPERFFVPAYVGAKGWVGARLDVEQDWAEIAELVEDSYRMIAPKRLVKLLDDRP